MIHTQTPGSHVVISFQDKADNAGESGGIAHFGFRLGDANDIDKAVEEVERAGRKLRRRGEF